MLFDPLTDDDLHHLGDIMTRVRDHMRARPPRSAAPRKRRLNPTPPSHDTGLNRDAGLGFALTRLQ